MRFGLTRYALWTDLAICACQAFLVPGSDCHTSMTLKAYNSFCAHSVFSVAASWTVSGECVTLQSLSEVQLADALLES